VGISAVSCGTAAGLHGFLIRKSRLSKMNMYINETGKNSTIMKFNAGNGNGRRNIGTNGGNATGGNENINAAEISIVEKCSIFENAIHIKSP
jgi:hypothetical protein